MDMMGVEIAKMHLINLIHGDLTTSNIMVRRIALPPGEGIPAPSGAPAHSKTGAVELPAELVRIFEYPSASISPLTLHVLHLHSMNITYLAFDRFRTHIHFGARRRQSRGPLRARARICIDTSRLRDTLPACAGRIRKTEWEGMACNTSATGGR